MFSSDVFDAEMALADSGDLLGNSPDFGFGCLALNVCVDMHIIDIVRENKCNTCA